MSDESVRLDKWLWAARFYKTRPLAQKAIEGGKVRVEGARAKPGKQVQVGQKLEIRVGQDRHEIEIRGLSAKRGPAPVARQLYEESAESLREREKAGEARRLAAKSEPDMGGRPNSYQRRVLKRFKRKNELR
ncbi:MAG: S4 domain-containing protein [Kiritimatiellae bacterium]|jgi:ribosome-associated heat shock protein Hsp15|nr:S4 domain-containing protein [Kiritimatiellia bacterium]